MTEAQRENFKKKLLDLQKEQSTKTAAKIEPNRTDENTVDAEDEQPLNEMLQSVASGRNKNWLQVMDLVTKALVKLRDDPDDYGICEDCAESIALPRLNAMPYALYCIECQSRADGPKGGPTRKRLSDYR